MLEFMIDNPVLLNVKMTDYRCKDKKDQVWEDHANLMGKTADTLKVWFRSLRDTHTRLDKKKSGDGAPDLTEREDWIIAKFSILKTVTRHRAEPLQSVSMKVFYFFWLYNINFNTIHVAIIFFIFCIQQQRGDLDAWVSSPLPTHTSLVYNFDL